MNKSGMLLPIAALLLSMPMMANAQPETSAASTTEIGQTRQHSLEGQWVDTSGRGVLTFDNGVAFFSPTGEADPENTYQVALTNNNQLTMTPTEGSKKTNKIITTEIDWNKQTFQFNNGLYNFVRPPRLLNRNWMVTGLKKPIPRERNTFVHWNIKIMHPAMTITGGE